MRILFYIILLTFISLPGRAQDTAKVVQQVSLAAEDDATILYRREASGGLTLHSNGWGVSFKSGKHVTGFRKRILDFDIVSMSHPKEKRTTNPYEGAKS